MHFRSNVSSPRFAGFSPRRRYLLCGLLLVLVWAILAWARPSYATDTLFETGQETFVDPGVAAPYAAASVVKRPFGSYIIQLEAEPVAALYASLAAGDQAQSAGINALTQAHLASVDQAQRQMLDALAGHEAQVIYRVQRVFNGVAVHMPVDQVATIAALPGVAGVYPLVPKEPANARAAKLLDAPAIWQGINNAGLNPTGLSGKGITIAIIDTGVDYLHTTFGGPGTINLPNDTNMIGDVPNFPGPKIAGGFDFAGDTYDATVTSVTYQPVPIPDPDPMDCYGFGHGTHVAGTAAGYGVRVDGTTYPGPFDTSIDLDNFRIGPGLAPEASIYALKVFGCSGSSNLVDAAIEWAVDPNQDGDFSDRVDVINLSLGSNFGAAFDATTIAVENAASLGILVVTSAGNTGDVHYSMGSPGVASSAIAVGATSISSIAADSLIDGTVASFSARGPRRGDHALKPDLVAPGVNIVSARRGTGNQSVTSSGTSMASPAVAGIMALLRQAHPEFGAPGWRAQELKALAMNTAVYPLLRPDVGEAYSLLRVGAGRIDPIAALQSNLIAYDALEPQLVSVNFGEVAVLDTTTIIRSVRIANKSAAPISVTVGYSSVRELSGVTIAVDTVSLITIPALGLATVPVTLTADAAKMARRADPARQLVSPSAYPWLDEAGGYVSFTPVITTSGPAIHLPVLALPRVTSALTTLSPPLDLGNRVTATFPLTVAGVSHTTVMTGAAMPSQTIPLIGLFGLAHSSPPLAQLPNGEPVLGRFAHADLRYIGTAGPVMVEGERMFYFVLVAYGPWSTPLEVIYQIAIDVNNDDLIDFRLENRESTDVSNFDFATSDDFVSLLETREGVRSIQGPLNIYSPTQFDTRPFISNVMVLPLRLDELGEDVSNIRYQVTSNSRDIIDEDSLAYIEATPILGLDVGGKAGVTNNRTLPLFAVDSHDPIAATIAVTIDREAYARQKTKGLLLLYLHNDLSTRSQTLPVQFDYFYRQYLPIIGAQSRTRMPIIGAQSRTRIQ